MFLYTESEFVDVAGRVAITAEPEYHSEFTAAQQVISYQGRLMNAENLQK